MKAIVVILLLANIAVFAAWQLAPESAGAAGGRAAGQDGLPVIRLLGEVAGNDGNPADNGVAGEGAAAGTNSAAEQTEISASSVPAGDRPVVRVGANERAGDEVTSRSGESGVASLDDILSAASAVVDRSVEELSVSADSGQPGAATAAAASSETDVQKTCYTIGPVFDESEALTMRSNIVTGQRRVFMRRVTSEQILNYRVLMPAQASAQAAQDLAGRLQAKGIDGVGVIAEGENQNTVSLGVYSGIDNARQRWQAIRAQGFVPLLRVDKEMAEATWFDVELPVNDQPDWVKSGEYLAVPVKQKSCTSIGAS